MDYRTSIRLAQTVSNLPSHGWAGLVLIGVCWPLNWGWGVDGLRTHLLFFPLWLGYILTVDALVYVRRGTSLLSRSRILFVKLFLISAPAWWLFELINWRTQNWQYLGREQFSDLIYFLFASVAFSTVIPAVFETADLLGGWRHIQAATGGPRIPRTRRTGIVLMALGLLMLALVLLWPRYFYPLTWGALFCLIEPVNVWRGKCSLLDRLQSGDWRPVAALALGSITCGFFWELWNYYAYPKWIYHTPGVGFLYIFEMPLIGFIGYLPFALELYALAYLALPRGTSLGLRFEQ